MRAILVGLSQQTLEWRGRFSDCIQHFFEPNLPGISRQIEAAARTFLTPDQAGLPEPEKYLLEILRLNALALGD